MSGGIDLYPLVGRRRPHDAAAKLFRPLAVVRPDPHGSAQAERVDVGAQELARATPARRALQAGLAQCMREPFAGHGTVRWDSPRSTLSPPAQPQQALRQDAAFEEGVDPVRDEVRQFGPGAALDVGNEAGRILLHRVVQGGLLQSTPLVVQRRASDVLWACRPTACTRGSRAVSPHGLKLSTLSQSLGRAQTSGCLPTRAHTRRAGSMPAPVSACQVRRRKATLRQRRVIAEGGPFHRSRCRIAERRPAPSATAVAQASRALE